MLDINTLKKLNDQKQAEYDAKVEATYQLVIPLYDNHGERFTCSSLRDFENHIIAYTNGFTCLGQGFGVWKNEQGKVFKDENLVYQIDTTASMISELALTAKEYFRQEAIYTCKVGKSTIF